nr:unnamed protein product [Callosobruchus analis]
MSSKFICCSKKGELYYICVSCFGVYYHSCAKRLREVLEKEKYIASLQRTTKDFENDVIEIEQKFVEGQNHLKDQKEQLYLMNTEMSKV